MTTDATTIATELNEWDAAHGADDNIWDHITATYGNVIDWDNMPEAGHGDDVIVLTTGDRIEYRGGEWIA